jgi:hypothetical protein
MSRKVNGWSNYATWKINAEILGDIEFDYVVQPSELKEIVEDCVFRNPNTCNTPYLIEDYARAFLAEVEYIELATAYNEDYKQNTITV